MKKTSKMKTTSKMMTTSKMKTTSKMRTTSKMKTNKFAIYIISNILCACHLQEFIKDEVHMQAASYDCVVLVKVNLNSLMKRAFGSQIIRYITIVISYIFEYVFLELGFRVILSRNKSRSIIFI